jgi:hypothetical protein
VTGAALAPSADAATVRAGQVTATDTGCRTIHTVNHTCHRVVARVTFTVTHGRWKGWSETGTYRLAAHSRRTDTSWLDGCGDVTRIVVR